MQKKDFDVVIVGGGVVGCTLACLLASNAETAQLSVAIIESTDSAPHVIPDQFDARVVALSNISQQIFFALGVWPRVLKQRQCAYKEMYVWDGEGTANIDFSCHDIRQEQLGFIVENNVILQALLETLQGFGTVHFIRSATVKDVNLSSDESVQKQTVSLYAENEVSCIHAGLVIAADGAHSSVRRLINMPTKEWDYGHEAIVTTVETELDHKQTAWQRFSATGPIAMLPLRNDLAVDVDVTKAQKYCSLVWSAETPVASMLMGMSDTDFCDKLGRAFEYKLGNIQGVDKRYSLPLRQRHAEVYVLPGLALVGDAAHTLHPLAGQGVNLGIYDVHALSKEIARSQRRSFSISDFSVLQRYERARQSHNLAAMVAMEGFKRLYSSRQPAVNYLRNTGMRFCNQQAWLKKKLILLASG